MKGISLKRAVLVHTGAVCAIVIYFLLPIKCPIKYFLGFDCPTCGMTRSLTELLKGDIALSLEFNPMTVPFLLLVLFALHRRLFPIKSKTANIIIIFGTVCVMISYIMRLIFI